MYLKEFPALLPLVFSVLAEMHFILTVENGLSELNKSLENGTPVDTLAALKDLQSYLPPIMDFAAPLYHEEMAADRSYAQVRKYYILMYFFHF